MLSDQEPCRILIAADSGGGHDTTTSWTLTVKAFNWFVTVNCLVADYRRYRPRRRGRRYVELRPGRNRDSKIPATGSGTKSCLTHCDSARSTTQKTPLTLRVCVSECVSECRREPESVTVSE